MTHTTRPKRLEWLRSPGLRSGVSFAAGGVGFALGNVLLARVLPEAEYGRVALVLALIQLGMVLGPMGVETLINRHHLHAERATLAQVSVTATLAAAAIALCALTLYEFGPLLAVLLALAVAGAALNRVAAAFFQSQRKFAPSLSLILVHNWVVLLAVPAVLLSKRSDALPAVLTITVAYIGTAVWGWLRAFHIARFAEAGVETEPALPVRARFNEGLMALGMQLAVIALYQLDRLLIPGLLSIHDLATYAVVSAIAASPFRMLQTGLAFSLLPRLRACKTVGDARRILRREIQLGVRVALLAAAGVLVITEPAVRLLLSGRYDFEISLLAAFVIVGLIRVWSGIAGATATAFGSSRDLAVLNACGWIALLLAAAGAYLARDAGLTGIVYGVGVGWLGLALAGSVIGRRAMVRRGTL